MEEVPFIFKKWGAGSSGWNNQKSLVDSFSSVNDDFYL